MYEGLVFELSLHFYRNIYCINFVKNINNPIDMKANISINEKLVRMILAAVAAAMAFNIHFSFGFVALFLMFTVVMSWCPIMQLIGRKAEQMESVR